MDECSSRMESSVAKDFISYIDSFMPLASDRQRLFLVRKLLKRCSLCSSRDTKSYPVPSYGSIDSSVLVLDSNPGVYQRTEGSPLQWSSPTLRVLSKLLVSAGYSVQDCFITYAFHCSFNMNYNNRDKCSLWLNYELHILSKVTTIVTLGEDAFHSVMGDSYPSIVDIYGHVYTISIFGRVYRVVPVMHPWFLLKSPSYYNITLDLMTKIRQ